MANEKYTMRAFLENVKAGNVGDVEKAYAEAEIAKLDARNEKRKGAESKTAKENAPIKEAIKAYVGENAGKTAKEIAEGIGKVGEVALTTAKVSALATILVKEGVLVTTEVKPAGGKGKVKAYTLA